MPKWSFFSISTRFHTFFSKSPHLQNLSELQDSTELPNSNVSLGLPEKNETIVDCANFVLSQQVKQSMKNQWKTWINKIGRKINKELVEKSIQN